MLSNTKLFGMIDSTSLLKNQDLTAKLIPYVDRHFALLLLNHTEKSGLYNVEEVKNAKLQILSSTFLIDALKDAGASSELLQERQAALEEATAEAAEGSKNEALLLFNKGEYQLSQDLLAKLRESGNTDIALVWGSYAANVMLGQFDKAVEDLSVLHEVFDYKSGQASMSSETQLNARLWYIHWTLFSLFHVNGGSERICDILLQSQFMCAIQAAAPWILRYLAIATLTTNFTKPRTNPYQRRLKELIKVVLLEQYEYTDAILDFVDTLFVRFDFDTVAEKLEAATTLLKGDYFANNLVEPFLQAARFHIIDLYFKVHDLVDITHLAPILSLTKTETQELLSELLADSRLECNPTVLPNGTYKTNKSSQSILALVREKSKVIESRSKQALAQVKARSDSA